MAIRSSGHSHSSLRHLTENPFRGLLLFRLMSGLLLFKFRFQALPPLGDELHQLPLLPALLKLPLLLLRLPPGRAENQTRPL